MNESVSHPDTSATVLLVEDNPGDVRLVEEAFSDGDDVTLRVVTDGDEALEYLYQRGEYADARRPELVLLDWNVPRTTGERLLEEVKGDPDRRTIPVIVLTGSQNESDVARSYQCHANACLGKAVEPDAFIESLRRCREFWLSTVRLPPGPETVER